MNPRQFLEVAKQLAAVGDGYQHAPAKHRTATSRAYYAAFNAAVNFLARVGIFVKEIKGTDGDKKSAHATVRKPFHNGGRGTPYEINQLLKDLFKQRKDADYDLQPPDPKDPDPDSKDEADIACQASEDIFDKIDDLLKPANFPGVQTTMLAYVRSDLDGNLEIRSPEIR